MSAAPSGEQHEIGHGRQRAVITEVGATIRSYEVDGMCQLLDGFGAGEMCTGGRGQPLVPWPNRIRDGRFRFGGRDHQLALTEPEQGNSIHGLVRWSNWRATERGSDRVLMRHVLHAQPGYPFVLDVALEYRLGDEGLEVTLAAINVSDADAPFAAGHHPYLRLDGPMSEWRLTLDAGAELIADERQIPTGEERDVAGTAADFRQSRPIGDQSLDSAFTNLARGRDGRAQVTLQDPRDHRLTLWMDPGWDYVMLFTGDALTQPERRRTGLAVEPMTAAPDAFRSGRGLRVLRPQERVELRWGISPG